jgi:hypothetical protein
MILLSSQRRASKKFSAVCSVAVLVKLKVQNSILRDIFETICIYNVLYATYRPFFQSIFSIFGWVIFLNGRCLNGFKTSLCVYRDASMVIWLKISIYCAIFFLTHNIHKLIINCDLKCQKMIL